MDTVSDHVSPVGAGDPKRAHILESAMGIFMSYGFSRSTMDDIARAAGMSRPALYLVFKNKREIFRAIVVERLEETINAATSEISGSGDFRTRLANAVHTGIIGPYCEIRTSPHGEELVDAKDGLIDDLIEEWHIRFKTVISEAIKTERADNKETLEAAGLTADGLAQTLIDGIEGIKRREKDTVRLQSDVDQLTSLISLAVAAP